jgi:hypothetical protein
MSEQLDPPVANVITEVRKLFMDAELGDIRAIAAIVVRRSGLISRVIAHPAGEHTNDLTAGVGDLFHGIHADRETLFLAVPEGEGNNE